MKSMLMRVPTEFYKTVCNLSKKHNLPMTSFLKDNATRLLENADALTDMIYFRRKR